MITRDPSTGVASSVRGEYTNGPYINFRGWTAEINYRFDLKELRWGGSGILDLGFYGYFPKNLKHTASQDIPAEESVGTIDNSKRQFQWNARYLTGPWNFGVSANYKALRCTV